MQSILVEASDDDFQPVRVRKKKRKGVVALVKPMSFSTRVEKAAVEINDTEWIEGCRKKVEVSFEKLGWSALEILVLCLGLGSPMESRSAAAQLACIAAICEAFHIAHDSVSFIDPHFSEEDVQGLLAMGFRVLSENKRGKYTIKRRTMLFMPHCGIELYENILRENWCINNLRHLLLLGNVLQEYATMTPGKRFEQQTPCLSRIWKYLTCDPVSPFDAYPLAFNNLGLQYINFKSLPSPEDLMWNLPSSAAPEKASAEIT